MLWNVPNTLTWIRIAAIPLIVLLFFMPYSWADPAAGLLFAPKAGSEIREDLAEKFKELKGKTEEWIQEQRSKRGVSEALEEVGA